MPTKEFAYQKIDTPKYCPSCAAPNTMETSCEISWDEERKTYQTKIQLYCVHGDYIEDLSALPVSIAQHSRCSCGGTLSLGNHKLSKQKEGEVELEATYFCEECQNRKRTLFRFVRDLLKDIWTSTKKVEVGPTGIRYEKA